MPTSGQVGARGAAWSSGSPETYMDIVVAGHPYQCLVDTGCDRSLIPRRLVPHARLNQVDIVVFAANGIPIPILGATTLRFTVQGRLESARLLVSDDVDEFMLGFDLLKAQGARWHFDEQVMLLHGGSVHLRTRKLRASCSQVWVREAFTVPARSATSPSG